MKGKVGSEKTHHGQNAAPRIGIWVVLGYLTALFVAASIPWLIEQILVHGDFPRPIFDLLAWLVHWGRWIFLAAGLFALMRASYLIGSGQQRRARMILIQWSVIAVAVFVALFSTLVIFVE